MFSNEHAAFQAAPFIDFNIVSTPPREPIEAIKARVDLADIVGRYVALKRRGREMWGCCPFHGERTASFKISPERQAFHCFGCGAKGDALDFLQAIERLDFGDACQRLRELAGDTSAVDPQRQARRDAAAKRDAAEAEAKREHAQEIWRQSETITGGPAITYLHGRGITRWGQDRLRYHPSCGFGWIETPPFGFRHSAPAIIAPVNDHVTGYVTAIWRIRLTPAGEKVCRLGLGDTKGNAARLFPAEGDALAVAEGVEDALAFAELSGLPTWAALSADNLAKLILPPRFTRVVICQDNDEPNRLGKRVGPDAAQALARRLIAEGRQVSIKKPTIGKDANDVALAGRDAA